MLLIFLFLAVLLLTYSNGANDNFKGVATLWGSGTLSYKATLWLATIATLLGSLCSYFFAASLIKNFSGKGLVPDEVLQSLPFIFSVAMAAAATVLLATRLGFPISTTHALVGALVGAGMLAVKSGVNFSKLGSSFFTPLLLSPAIAVVLGSTVYALFHFARKRAGIRKEINLGTQYKQPAEAVAFSSGTEPLPAVQVSNGTSQDSIHSYKGHILGINFQSLLNTLHYISAALVSFARGLNDTPKLVSLLLITRLLIYPFILPCWQ